MKYIVCSKVRSALETNEAGNRSKSVPRWGCNFQQCGQGKPYWEDDVETRAWRMWGSDTSGFQAKDTPGSSHGPGLFKEYHGGKAIHCLHWVNSYQVIQRQVLQLGSSRKPPGRCGNGAFTLLCQAAACRLVIVGYWFSRLHGTGEWGMRIRQVKAPICSRILLRFYLPLPQPQ